MPSESNEPQKTPAEAEPMNTAPTAPRPRFAAAARDVWIALFLLVAGAAAAMAYLCATGTPYNFYQERLGPAVMLACGRGFVDPDLSQCPPLRDFLEQKTDRFSPDALPADLRTSEPTSYQAAHRYLYGAVAWTWRVSGISWPAVLPLFGLLYGITVACAYGLFRLGMGRPLAMAGALLILMSPVHLSMVPLLRDYAKAPFLLAAFLIMGRLVKGPFTKSSTLGLAALGGLVVGLGMGFRKDLLICVPGFILVLLCFLPKGGRGRVVAKLGALVVFAACCIVCSLPILLESTGGSNTIHLFLLGLTKPFDAMLGVAGTPCGLNAPYNDAFIISAINGCGYLKDHNTTTFGYYVPEYGLYGRQILLAMARHFPADMAIRAFAAVLRILNEMPFANLAGFFNEELVAPAGATNDFVLKLYEWRLDVLRPLQGLGFLFAAAALVLISTRNLRAAVFCLFFLMYFAGHTALQFALRHVFHLEFIAFWALGFLLHQTGRWAYGLVRGKAFRRAQAAPSETGPGLAPVKRVLVFLLGPCLFLVLALYGLRCYQDVHVEHLMQAYLAANRLPLALTRADAGQGSVLIGVDQAATPLFNGQDNLIAKTDYLVAEFQSDVPRVFETLFWYDAEKPGNDISSATVITTPSGGSPTYAFFPVYDTTAAFGLGARTFQGLVLPQEHAGTLTGLYRVSEPENLPLLLYITLMPDWQAFRHYQVLTR